MDQVTRDRVIRVLRESTPIFRNLGHGSLIDILMKAEEVVDTPGASAQGASTGRRLHPFNFEAVAQFRHSNPHHSTCIITRKESTVGLGFEDEEEKAEKKKSSAQLEDPSAQAAKKKRKRLQSKVAKVLDPLCVISFQDVLGDAVEEFGEVGNGYIEVVREKPESSAKITGLHHLRARNTHVCVDNKEGAWHFEFDGNDDAVGGTRRFAPFGQLESFIKRMKAASQGFDDSMVSEVIHFRQSSALSKWYGFPTWLSAVPSIELTQMMTQHQFDFFQNRGVPEFLLFILGGKVSDGDWEKIDEAMKANIGLGNSHKSLALNLTDSNIKVELHKLAMEGKADGALFAEMSDVNALNIVSAHRTPPLLAGIQIPGKLGATNELPNALKAYQALVIDPAQTHVTGVLAKTLGNEKLNGGLGLGPDDFVLRRITDEFDMGEMDTVARMRQTVPEAKAEGRDLKAGLKKAQLEELMADERLGAIIGHALTLMLKELSDAE